MNLERTFFVTTVTWKRTPIFRQHASQLMVDVLKHHAEQGKFVLHEFVIMPDHLHLLLTPAKDISLERALQVIKGGFSYRLGKKHGPVWQESFTNHHVRDEGDYLRQAEYIRLNPARAQIVETVEPIRTRRPPGLRVVQPRSVSWREHGRPSAALDKKQIPRLRRTIRFTNRSTWFGMRNLVRCSGLGFQTCF